MREARLWQKIEGTKRVQCYLCAHRCNISEGKKGLCQVRQNIDGTLYTQTYGRVIAAHVDPIEKKPLYHFYPGSTAYSLAAPGCNFRCRWCQNWEISQLPHDMPLTNATEVPPEQIVAEARRTNCRSIAYTYTEPTIFFEYSYDIAVLAHGAGLANVYVTNGYMTAEMLEAFYPYLDAANVDLKAFRDETYRRLIGGSLQPVLDSLKKMKQQGIWLEVTTLVIPGVNDDEAELRAIAAFLVQELGMDTPWHISRFFPMYKLVDAPPTPLETLRRAEEIGRAAGLHYVYIGNARADTDTICPNCGQRVIRRLGYTVIDKALRSGHCANCGLLIPGLGLG